MIKSPVKILTDYSGQPLRIDNSSLAVSGTIAPANFQNVFQNVSGALNVTNSLIQTTGSISIQGSQLENSLILSNPVFVASKNASGQLTSLKLKYDGAVQTRNREEPTFLYNRTNILPTFTNPHIVALWNGAVGQIVKIYNITYSTMRVNVVTPLIAGTQIRKITSQPVGADDTSTLVSPLDTNDSVSAGITWTSLPTIASINTTPIYTYRWSTDESVVPTEDLESADRRIQQLITRNFNYPKPIVLRQSESITLQLITNTTTLNIDVRMLVTIIDEATYA